MPISVPSSRPSAVHENSDDIDFTVFFSMMWRYKYISCILIFLGLGIAVLFAQTATPLYRSSALIVLNSPSAGAGIGSLGSALGIPNVSGDNSYVISETEILRSRDLVQHVIVDMGLLRENELHKIEHKGDKAASSNDSSFFKSFNFYNDVKSLPPLAPASPAMNKKISSLLDNLSIKALPGSSVLKISMVDTNALQAARITNRIIDLYIRYKDHERKKSALRTQSWITKQKDALLADIRKNEEKLLRFQKEHDLSNYQDTNLVTESLLLLQSRLQKAQEELASTEILVEYIKDFNPSNGDFNSLSEVIKSPVIQRIKAERSAAMQNIANLSSRYGPKHPVIIQAQARLDELDQALQAEFQTIQKSIYSNRDLAKDHVVFLEDELQKASEHKFDNFEALIEFQILKSDLDSKRLFYNKLLENYQLLSADSLQEEPAKIISRAVPAEGSFSPNKKIIVVLGGIIGFCAAFILAIIRQNLDRTFRTNSDIENYTAQPCYGLIPYVDTKTISDTSDYIVKYPASLLSEAVRTLRTLITMRAYDKSNPPKVICLTSSYSGEGKTTLSTWLARSSVQAGERVLLIDCDLRRPNVHKAIPQDFDMTLVDYLTDVAELEDIIYKDLLTGLSIIYSHSVPNTALNLISGHMMRDLIIHLRDQYDLIILDAPACMAVSDARILSSLADLTVYVARWAHTPDHAISYGMKQLSDIDANLATVLTGVDMKRQKAYGDGAMNMEE